MDGKDWAEKIKTEWLAMDIQRSGTDSGRLWMMVQDLLAIIRDNENRLQSVMIERDVFQKENHRLLSIMVEKGWLTNG